MLLERTQLTLRYADPGEETAALEDYLSLCLRWLDEGLKACPKEIGGLFQSYTSARFVELFSFMSNDSSRVASLFRKFCSDTDFASSLVSALSRQGHYAGEIAGMSEVLKGAPSASISLSTSQRQLKEISANIKLNFKALRVHEKNDAFIPAFSTCMHRAAAVLLAQQQVNL